MIQELYALGANRSATFNRAFLDRFLPDRKPCSQDYPVPEAAAEPEAILETESEILVYLESHPKEPYGLYWNDAAPSTYDQAMLFYTSDGMVIFGLACGEHSVEEKLKKLRECVGAKWAMKGWEQRPPETSTEFIKLCQQAGT